jgi:Asp-tRNA(Asn)/Glu-tRNA(Gln) amidotransferase B subunit
MAFTVKNGPSSADKLLNFLVGKVMRATSGLAAPQTVRRMILERINTQSTE